ncbi:DUF5590 domain-containing protein [Microaerobacter geothermalis]|uniref:cell wall elongation regulator TseB-like domain-containing protein n=1 Tax=Microaerobacter geothermalis TaxID=674972 RepID=UPI001F3ED0AF|nr:DUF5590 domain-containing protein [Microaerobacter geothermalis]MCF6093338.1 DUF5590 domain-containing protein [Microaerobacter geothermalis]
MKKWLWIVIAILFMIPGYISYDLYSSLKEQKTSLPREVLQLIKDKTVLTEVTYVDFYYGSEAYWVIKGNDQKKQPVYVWVREDLNSYYVEYASRGRSEEELRRQVAAVNPEGVLVHLVPAREGKKVYWEAKVKNKNGDFIYYLYDFYSGELWKSYLLKNRT